MAKQSNRTATWTQIDTDSLPANIKQLYDAYKTQYAEMKRLRLEFEDSVARKLAIPAGQKAVFGYNFGKLSCAIVDDDKPAAKASSAVSLASLIRR